MISKASLERLFNALVLPHFDYTSQTSVEIYGKHMVRLAFPWLHSRLNASGTGRSTNKKRVPNRLFSSCSLTCAV